jgi:hypothetical protein
MPFRHEDISAFGPDDLTILYQAFNLAWQRLLDDGLAGDKDQLEEARRRLATCIVVHARRRQSLQANDLIETCLVVFNRGKVKA